MPRTSVNTTLWPLMSADADAGGDRQLLERFVAERDEAAFAGLVNRHGRSVWGVCRRVLGREQDAEDAFQAVFLVLARKAASIRRGEAVGSWLYGVAYRLSVRAKQNAARRYEREKSRPETRSEPTPPGEAACRELQRILDEEVQRLKEKYRAPFVLCCLEGMSKAEAAKELGWKEGTVSGRLARARKLLQTRLARRGFTLSAALTACALASQTASAAVPASLMQTTASAVLAHEAARISPSAVALADAYLRRLWLAQLATGLAVLLILILLLVGTGLAALTCWPGADANNVVVIEPESFVPPGVPLGTPIGEQVLTVAFTPDSKHLVTGGAWSDLPGQFKIWNVTSGKEMAAVTRIPGVRTAAFSPDGQSLATGDCNGAITLRDPDTGEQRLTVQAHAVGVTGLAYSPDGEFLVSTGLDRLVKVWTARGMRAPKSLVGHADQVSSVAFFRHGQAIVTGSRDRTAKLWNLATGKERFTLAGHRSAVEAVAISPDDKFIATASSEATVKLWDAETGAEVAALEGEKGQSFLAVAFSPDGAMLAAGGRDGAVHLWDMKTRQSLGTLEKHKGAIWALAFSRDGVLASGSADKTAKLWNFGKGKRPKTLTTPWSGIRPVRAAVYAPDGTVLAVATTDHTVHIRDAKSGDIITVLRGHTAPVNCLAFTPDGRTLASGSDDATVKLWDWATGDEMLALVGHVGPVNALAFTRDGKKLASAGDDETIRIRDVATGNELAVLWGHRGPVRALAMAPDDQKLASGGNDRTVKIWDLIAEKEVNAFQGHRAAVRALAFSKTGLLASAGDDATVKLWDPADGAERFTLEGHTKAVCALAFSGKGQTLVSAGLDATVRVWDPITGRPRAILKGHNDAVTALTIHPHGQNLVSGSHDTMLMRWRSGEPGAGLNPPVAVNKAIDIPPGDAEPVVFQDVGRISNPAHNTIPEREDVGRISKGDSPPKEKVVKDYFQSLKGKLPADAGLVIKGPDADQCVKFEPEGLRILLPTGYVGERPITGLVSNFGLQGDFEITLNYDVLKDPDAAAAGTIGTRLTIGVLLNRPTKNLANFSRKITTKTGPHYALWSNANDKDKPNSRFIPAKANSGRLRLARVGNVLSCYAAEGADQEFALLQEFPCAVEDVREIRITANTGGDKAEFDVRVTDLRIRAAALLKTPEVLAPPPPEPAPPPRELAERLNFAFPEGIDKHPMLRLFGPESGAIAKVEPKGLRFNVSAERSSNGPVGVEAAVRLRGDFEITLAYELLAVPIPPPPLGAGLSLRVDFDTPNSLQAHLGRSQRPNGPGAGANYSSIGPDGKEVYRGLTFRPAKEPTGRLRLVRTGTKLSYQLADGDGAFHVLATKDIGAADVSNIRIQANTGWQPKVGVHVRFASLDLRANKIIRQVADMPERVEFKFEEGIEKNPRLRFVGPDAASMAKTDAQGLRFLVPPDRESGAQVGVEYKNRLRGDFEITLAFDLLALPNPPPKLGAGLDIQVDFDSPDGFKAQMGRVKNVNGSVVGANYITKGPDGNESFKGITVQFAKHPSGRMRLARVGKKLIYQFADAGGPFQLLATKEIGTADVLAVRALCTTGWQTASGVEVRLINLELRSGQMPDKDAPPPPSVPDGPGAAPPEGRPKIFLIISGLVVGLLVILLVGTVGLWFVLAKRRNAGAATAQADADTSDPADEVEPASAPIFAVCRGCRKKLKVRPGLAGKKVKCPKCGQAVLVSTPSAGDANGTPS